MLKKILCIRIILLVCFIQSGTTYTAEQLQMKTSCVVRIDGLFGKDYQLKFPIKPVLIRFWRTFNESPYTVTMAASFGSIAAYIAIYPSAALSIRPLTFCAQLISAAMDPITPHWQQPFAAWAHEL